MPLDEQQDGLIELRFYVPLDTKYTVCHNYWNP